MYTYVCIDLTIVCFLVHLGALHVTFMNSRYAQIKSDMQNKNISAMLKSFLTILLSFSLSSSTAEETENAPNVVIRKAITTIIPMARSIAK